MDVNDVLLCIWTTFMRCAMNAGTVILTGTPAGVGFARTPPVYLQPGDMVEVCAPSGMLPPQRIHCLRQRHTDIRLSDRRVRISFQMIGVVRLATLIVTTVLLPDHNRKYRNAIQHGCIVEDAEIDRSVHDARAPNTSMATLMSHLVAR
jgi:hypothetical protein